MSKKLFGAPPTLTDASNSVVVRGAREHNLKEVDVSVRVMHLLSFRGSLVPVSLHWLLEPFMLRRNDATLNRLPRMRGASLIRPVFRMWMPLMDSPLQLPFNNSEEPATHALLSAV